ncbi:MAG: triose-phosphate isomerase [Bacillota bacterium]
MRKPFIAGNWKMNKTISEGVEYINELKDLVKDADADVAICAPATMLKDLKKAAEGTNIKIGAENMHYEDSGSYTGEISPKMLTELDMDYVVLGHSERRTYYNETDEAVNKKTLKALEVGIDPIICVGESLDQRENGEMKDFVKKQVEIAFKDVKKEDATKVTIAYEPLWAIGTGKTATSEQANEMTSYIRSIISDLYDKDTAEKIRIQYGGSVKPHNVEGIMAESDIDGALVGGASLEAESFSKVVKF